MHIFTYKIQKYFKLIKLIIKMRCRHQAITISSKAKKGILKDLLIDNHSNANDQDEYLTEYFLSKFPKSQINEEKKNEIISTIAFEVFGIEEVHSDQFQVMEKVCKKDDTVIIIVNNSLIVIYCSYWKW